jgi:hypothetical protein
MEQFHRFETFFEELKTLCNKYEVLLVGTCEDEGIYSEITILDAKIAQAQQDWININRRLTAKLRHGEMDAHFTGVGNYDV